ncbi:Chaperone protein HtpG [uncultured delta proteobacterium]|uniref:Chaperone protein HtpG n=1 Tax=uncultured delta proteobacterium TaxID=34034 RepID=A0A212K194_9DELT|nr:Chaperone protein HtpG [uncultured delta proteobacterium]
MAKAKTLKFKAETQKVLNILTHSLYTNREIFLRELLSNASDALDKLRFLQSKGEEVRDSGLPLQISITVDKDAGVLQIADTGLGMTERELIDNLGTIAKSGSEEFRNAMETGEKAPEGEETGEGVSGETAEDSGETATATGASGAASGENEAPSGTAAPSASQIIGRFGVGFYSVFMVADHVEVISKAAQGDEPPHVWTSEGIGSFSIRPLEGVEADTYARGTVIRATLKDDAKEFLQAYRLKDVIRRHSNFLPFPINLEGEQINTTPALWRESKFAITREQYNEFYTYLTQDDTPPLEVIHLSVDAPVQFNALIFIPDAEADYFNVQRDQWGLDLYARRVLIERGNKELVPEYLAFLKGVVDTEDLPLNISRETLQENVVLRKISQTIVKQVLSHLEKMAANDKEKYGAFWKRHGKYFKFAFQDYANRDKVAPLLRFASSASEGGSPGASADGATSFDAYLERAKPDQKEIWYLAAPSLEAAKVNPHMERFRRKGLEVLYLLEPVDEFALDSLGKYKDHPFRAVEQAEAKDLDAFPDVDDARPETKALSDEEKTSLDGLVGRMRAILGDRVKDIRVSERLAGSPAVLVSPDGVSSSMEKLMRVMQKNEEIPKKILEINPDHPLFRSILRIFASSPENPVIADVVNGLFDNVLLLDGYLGDPYLMADRNLKLMDKAASWYADLLKI